MTSVDIGNRIHDSVSAIRPLDDIERQHIDFVLNWIQSSVEIFRTEKPAIPPMHLVSYFLVFSPEQSRVLLVDHKKAELWLPPGGHVEPSEDPKETVSSYATKVESLHPYKEADRFLSMIPLNGKIIDIGCGSGRDAKVFSKKGYAVTEIDFSSKMIEVAQEKAHQADFHVMDMRSLNFDLIFDGAWANASLLHLSKNEFLYVLTRIFQSLKPDGLFFIKLKKGASEGLELDSRYNNLEKFYSYHDEQELKDLLLAAGFTVLDLFVTENESSYQTHPHIHAFCRKNPSMKKDDQTMKGNYV